MTTFSKEDVKRLKIATGVCKQTGIELVVISGGMIKGFNDQKTAAIFAALPLSVDIEMGTTRLTELDKRLSIFADIEQLSITPEFSKDNKVRSLTCRGAGTKFDFKCTDTKLLERKYPKGSNARFTGELAFTREESALLVRGARTFSAGSITIHANSDGVVTVQAMNDSRESFEIKLKTPSMNLSSGFSYDLSTSPVLQLIDKADADGDLVKLKMDSGGILGMSINGLDILITPIIHRTGSNDDE